MEVSTPPNPLALQPTVDIMLTFKARFRLMDFSRHLKDAVVKYSDARSGSPMSLMHSCMYAVLYVVCKATENWN